MAALDAQLKSNGYPTQFGHASVLVSTMFRVGFRGRSFISVVGDGFYAATPSAHPNDFRWTQNLDASTGKSLAFGDLFFTDAAHKRRLHDLIEQSLRAAPYAKQYGLVESYDAGDFPGDLQPLVCAGRVRFFDIFDVHAVASVTTFVSGMDLIAGGVVKSRAVIAVLEQPRRASDTCGQF
ncbi:MAG TPA: hypothetical protein VFO25_06050 [Candidatus Eremiobacteraceae bacterium]|nr:hypothetical protein [Candidatus Eremiobacteraceae bacterium]